MFTIKIADKEMCSCRNCGGRFSSDELHEISVTRNNTTVSFGVFCKECIDELKDTLECYSRG